MRFSPRPRVPARGRRKRKLTWLLAVQINVSPEGVEYITHSRRLS
jgi:hypothetical protein